MNRDSWHLLDRCFSAMMLVFVGNACSSPDAVSTDSGVRADAAGASDPSIDGDGAPPAATRDGRDDEDGGGQPAASDVRPGGDDGVADAGVEARADAGVDVAAEVHGDVGAGDAPSGDAPANARPDAGVDLGASDAAAGPRADGGVAADVGAALPPTIPASDEFNGSTLDPSWLVYNPERVTLAVVGGVLSMKPLGGALWFADGSGPLVYKLVTGDFKATAMVHARKATDSTAPPDLDIEVGGVMARAPGADQNYVFLDVGYAEQQRLGVEHKSTIANDSVFDETPSGADAELRVCRAGATFTLLRRDAPTQPWRTELQVSRPDLPATLQVGPNASTIQAAPNLAVTFDQVTFNAVGAGCDQ
jgi:hypothetical protein